MPVFLYHHGQTPHWFVHLDERGGNNDVVLQDMVQGVCLFRIGKGGGLPVVDRA